MNRDLETLELVYSSDKRIFDPSADRVQDSIKHFIDKTKARSAAIAQSKQAHLLKKKEQNILRHQERLRISREQAEVRKMMKESLRVNKRFGEAVANKREALGISEEVLADVMDFPVEVIEHIELGRDGLYFDTAVRLAKVLQINVSCIMDMVTDIDSCKHRLSLAVDSKAQEIDSEMKELERQMQALRDQKNLVNRIKNG